MSRTEFIVRFTLLDYPDPLEPKYIDTVFFTSKAAMAYLTDAFDELDDVQLFIRQVCV